MAEECASFLLIVNLVIHQQQTKIVESLNDANSLLLVKDVTYLAYLHIIIYKAAKERGVLLNFLEFIIILCKEA